MAWTVDKSATVSAHLRSASATPISRLRSAGVCFLSSWVARLFHRSSGLLYGRVKAKVMPLWRTSPEHAAVISNVPSGLLSLGPAEGFPVVLPPDFQRAGEGQDVVEPPGRIRIAPGQHRARPAASRNRDSGRGEVAREGNVDSVPVSSHRCVVGDQPAAGPPACSPPVMTAGSADVKRIAVHQFGPLARS